MSTVAILQPPATNGRRCAADAAGSTGDQGDGSWMIGAHGAGRHERSSGNELPPSTTIC